MPGESPSQSQAWALKVLHDDEDDDDDDYGEQHFCSSDAACYGHYFGGSASGQRRMNPQPQWQSQRHAFLPAVRKSTTRPVSPLRNRTQWMRRGLTHSRP